MRKFVKALIILTTLVMASASYAQEQVKIYDFKEEVTEALREASDLASILEEDLLQLIPKIKGWSCEQDLHVSRSISGALAAVPTISMLCQQGEQSLQVSVTLDPSAAKVNCQYVEQIKVGIADGRVKPALFRFFDTDGWLIMRTSRDLMGCYKGVLALNVLGPGNQAALDAGPSFIDGFAEEMLQIDINELLNLDTFLLQQNALQIFVGGLRTQSEYLAAILPLPDDTAENLVIRIPPITISGFGLPLLMELAAGPAARATFEINGCSIHVELSASNVSIREAINTGQKWARPGGTDGKISHAYRRRNTDRFVGQERVDGTSIEAFVDASVIVRVVIPGADRCESEPAVVARLFSEILASDFSIFGIK